MELVNDYKKVSQFLRGKGIRPSYPRIRIYDYLQSAHTHPTVDTIYQELLPSMPTLSRTTVYNTVWYFVERGIILLISIVDQQARFDATIRDHGHFRCQECGEIRDFRIDSDLIETNLDFSFTINQKHFYYYGVCAQCKKNIAQRS